MSTYVLVIPKSMAEKFPEIKKAIEEEEIMMIRGRSTKLVLSEPCPPVTHTPGGLLC